MADREWIIATVTPRVVDGGRYIFDVVAVNEHGQELARGTHERRVTLGAASPTAAPVDPTAPQRDTLEEERRVNTKKRKVMRKHRKRERRLRERRRQQALAAARTTGGRRQT